MRAQYVTPWCEFAATSDEVGVGTQYQFGGSDRGFIDDYQIRRKNWRIHGNVIDYVAGTPIAFDHIFKAVMNNERTPVCAGYGFRIIENFDDAGDIGVDVGDPSYRFTIAIQVGGNANALPFEIDTRVAVRDGSFYIPFCVQVNAGVGGADEESFSLVTDFGSVSASALSVLFGGTSLPMFYNTTGPIGDVEGGEINIEAPDTNGFFEYRDDDGNNPVYDGDTGDQLIVPVPLA